MGRAGRVKGLKQLRKEVSKKQEVRKFVKEWLGNCCHSGAQNNTVPPGTRESEPLLGQAVPAGMQEPGNNTGPPLAAPG